MWHGAAPFSGFLLAGAVRHSARCCGYLFYPGMGFCIKGSVMFFLCFTTICERGAMSVQSILAVVDHRDSADNVMRAALALAEHHDAHITGLFSVPPFELPAFYTAGVPEAMLEAHSQATAAAAEQARAIFDKMVKAAGRQERSEFIVAEGSPVDNAAYYSRLNDLTIVAQETEGDSGLLAFAHPTDLLMKSGRACLVVPHDFKRDTLGKSIVVAWDSSREAARAVGDAMLLFEKAEKITACTVDANAKPPHLGEAAARELAEHLARHGFKVEARYQQLETQESIAGWLMKQAADTGADMIVMGGYGHSRLREFVLGGETKHMLQNMDRPVLFSH